MEFYDDSTGYEYYVKDDKFYKHFTSGFPAWYQEIKKGEYYKAFLHYLWWRIKTFDYFEVIVTILSLLTFFVALFLIVMLILVMRFN